MPSPQTAQRRRTIAIAAAAGVAILFIVALRVSLIPPDARLAAETRELATTRIALDAPFLPQGVYIDPDETEVRTAALGGLANSAVVLRELERRADLPARSLVLRRVTRTSDSVRENAFWAVPLGQTPVVELSAVSRDRATALAIVRAATDLLAPRSGVAGEDALLAGSTALDSVEAGTISSEGPQWATGLRSGVLVALAVWAIGAAARRLGRLEGELQAASPRGG